MANSPLSSFAGEFIFKKPLNPTLSQFSDQGFCNTWLVIRRPCYDQLTSVKTGYLLTSVMTGSGVQLIEVKCVFKFFP